MFSKVHLSNKKGGIKAPKTTDKYPFDRFWKLLWRISPDIGKTDLEGTNGEYH